MADQQQQQNLTLGDLLCEAQRSAARNRVNVSPKIDVTVPGTDATSAEQNFQMKMLQPKLPGTLMTLNGLAAVPDYVANIMTMVEGVLEAPEGLLSHFKDDGNFPTYTQAQAYYEDILYEMDTNTPSIFRSDPHYRMMKKILAYELDVLLLPRNVGEEDRERNKHEKKSINVQDVRSSFREVKQGQRPGIGLNPFKRR